MLKNKIAKRLLKIGVPLLLVGGLIYYKIIYYPSPDQSGSPKKSGEKSIPVNAYVIKPQKLNDGIQAVGTLMPAEEVDLVAETSGKVTGIFFKEGTRVDKGTLLVKVDDSDLQAQLLRAQYQHKLLSERLERQRILFEKDAVSREEYDQVQTDYNMVEADMELLKVKIAKTELRAPFSGIIGFRNVSLGAYLQNNIIVSHLVDDSRLKIDFSIPEKYASRDLNGAMVKFRTESSDREFSARIYAIDPRVDTKTRTILLRAICENFDKALSPGMFARINLITGRTNKAILIPTQSVVPDMDGKSVWVLRNGKAYSQKVETGQRTEDRIEVISGVMMGDTILISGLMQVREGSSLKLSKVE
ncbi:efflux RND transporter periplasmic adaptor subunit [Coprobacter tertius]|uniref:Efflux RND transporter periplasmic adaptor subunit n=1 Tax=Coprobacter tertius TaxID=2944915 RepID=A0ABT1MHD3_9BACT|nr:efflux RND transporter periplasmic adaptor subunit [Coprobacter tertius]MCP9612048.1 efflux RND transporter periplasmic adaptor subunit [Coprobacter tertius]